MLYSHTEKQRDDIRKQKRKHWNKTYQLAKLL